MCATLREQGIETVHDQVVSLVAQRWAKAFVCKVTIRTSLEQNLWADPSQQCDIVGWYVGSGGNTMEWMAEVETRESLTDQQTPARWKKATTGGTLLSAGAARVEGIDASIGAECLGGGQRDL